MRIAISGVQGFVGRHLVQASLERGFEVTALSRSSLPLPSSEDVSHVVLGSESGAVDYSNWNVGVDVFVHLAGRAHVLRETAENPRDAFWMANVVSTMSAARRAHQLGVKRFVFVSSIGVHGVSSDRPVTAASRLNPQALYAESKMAAEEALMDFQAKSGLDVLIVRPPLMYGPGVGANFYRLIKLVDTGFPLPFAAVENRKSFLGVRNFVDFIIALITSGELSENAYVPADRETLCTPQLLTKIAFCLGRRSLLFPIPSRLLKAGAALVGKREIYRQLAESLWVDTDVLKRTLEWEPPFAQDKLLAETIDWYLENKRARG